MKKSAVIKASARFRTLLKQLKTEFGMRTIDLSKNVVPSAMSDVSDVSDVSDAPTILASSASTDVDGPIFFRMSTGKQYQIIVTERECTAVLTTAFASAASRQWFDSYSKDALVLNSKAAETAIGVTSTAVVQFLQGHPDRPAANPTAMGKRSATVDPDSPLVCTVLGCKRKGKPFTQEACLFVHKRRHEGYRQPNAKCTNCARVGPISVKTATDKFCQACYNSLGYRKQITCYNCKKEAPCNAKTDDGPVCMQCYHAMGLQPTVECCKCKAMRPCNGNTDDGPVCRACYDALEMQPKVQCSNCDTLAICCAKTATGPVCERCYRALDLQPKVKCITCGTMAPCVSRTADGPVCKGCNKIKCTVCGFMMFSSNVASHARVHSDWAFKSTLEEAAYKALVALGFTEASATTQVVALPPPGQFAYDTAVFRDLIGTGGVRLRPDFVIQSLDGRLHWVEVNGMQHYQPVQFGSMDPEQAARQFDKQMVHDQLKRDYALKHGITLHEVKYSESRTRIPIVMKLCTTSMEDMD
jgi:hypothetical protein